MQSPSPLRLSLALATLLFASCAAQRSITKAEPTAFLRSSGPVNASQMQRLPFERAWKSPTFNLADYSSVLIRPVTTRYLRSENWQESASPFITNERDFQRQSAELARFWDAKLRKAFSDPANRFTLVHRAQPGTLIIEIALTEVVFGHPVANLASYAVPGGSAVGVITSPSVACEARIIDASTQQIVAAASDRRSSKLKLIDVNKLTFTKSNEEICAEWSVQAMQALNKEKFPNVKRTWVSLY